MAESSQLAEDYQQTQKKLAKKPYTKPGFRFERIVETSALSCGKMLPSTKSMSLAERFSGVSPKSLGSWIR
jgi:hypothetical protein